MLVSIAGGVHLWVLAFVVSSVFLQELWGLVCAGGGEGCGLGRRAAGAAASLDTNDRAARESSCNHAHNVMTDNLAICACTTHCFAVMHIPCMYCMHAGMRMVPMLIKYAYESMARVKRNAGMHAMASL